MIGRFGQNIKKDIYTAGLANDIFLAGKTGSNTVLTALGSTPVVLPLVYGSYGNNISTLRLQKVGNTITELPAGQSTNYKVTISGDASVNNITDNIFIAVYRNGIQYPSSRVSFSSFATNSVTTFSKTFMLFGFGNELIPFIDFRIISTGTSDVTVHNFEVFIEAVSLSV